MHKELYRERMPVEFLPIAASVGSNAICLKLGGDRIGSVWYWDHDDEAEEGEPAAWDNLTLVADDFTHFFLALRPA